MMAIFKVSFDELPKVTEAMKGIKYKDISFRYDIVEAYEGGYLLFIFDSDKDRLHRRALWVRDKVFGGDRGYAVKE